MDADVEKLLAEEPEKKDLKPEEKPAEQEQSPAEEAGQKDETKALKRELKRRQEEIDRLKSEKDKPKEEQKADPDDELATREGWLKRIEKTAEDKAEEKLKPLKEANLSRAVRKFIERHPEYASGDRKTMLKECVDSASDKLNEDDILERMSQTWASQNWKELEKESSRRDSARGNAQKSALKAAATGEGVRNEDDFTEEERLKAEKLGMSVEDYRKARNAYRSNSVNVM
jgi:hypothetical protein